MTRSLLRAHRRHLLAGAALAGMAGVAFAQGASTPLEAVTVEGLRGTSTESATGPVPGYVATRSASATKTDTPLIATPASIAVIGAEQIRDQNAQTLSEALRYAPGVRSEQFGSNSRLDFYTIRGFKADDTGLYLDGLQLFSTAFANFRVDPFLLERVEVLRGPASVLFGGTSPGGLVNLVSKKPLEEPFRYVEVGGGSYSRIYTNFDLSGPVDADRHWLYRLTGTLRGSDTQVDFARDDRFAIAPSFTYRPDASTSLTVLSSFQLDQSNTVGGFLPYDGTVRRTAIGGVFTRIPDRLFVSDLGIDRFQRQQAFLGYQFEHRVDDVWTLRQNVRYSYLDVSDERLYGAGYANPFGNAGRTELARFNFRTTPRVNLFTTDNQVEAKVDTGPLRHTILAGIDYKYYHLDDNQAFSLGPNLAIFAPNYRQTVAPASPYLVARTSLDQVGFYLQDQVRFGRFVLSLSGRGDVASAETRNRLTFARATREDTFFSGKVGLLYESEIGISPYATYSNSFTPVAGTNASGALFRPETGEEIEVGAKFQPAGWNTFATVSAFELRRNNVQTVDPTNIFNQVQTGQQKSTGMEFQLVSQPVEGLKVVGAYTVFDLRVTKDNDPTILGRTPVAIPQDFGSLYADYTFQGGVLRGFGFGAGVRYVGSSFATATNSLKVPDHVLMDASIHYDWDNWRLQANAQNLLDRRFVASCSDANSCFYGDRRRVNASLSYRW